MQFHCCAGISDGLFSNLKASHMIGRLFRIFLVFALIALIINRLFNRKQKRALREVMQISAWVLLGAAAATLIWYLVMLYFKHIPDTY